jgi:hypothetical protein
LEALEPSTPQSSALEARVDLGALLTEAGKSLESSVGASYSAEQPSRPSSASYPAATERFCVSHDNLLTAPTGWLSFFTLAAPCRQA